MSDESGPNVVVLPEWLDPPHLPGLEYAFYDNGDPAPAQAVLDWAVCYVPPYMCDLDTVGLARRMPKLQLVQALMAGVDGWASVVPAGVEVRRAHGVHDDSTAELAVGLMIAMQRGIDISARDMVAGVWRQGRRPALADSRIGLLGWGGIGRAIAARLAPFVVDVVPFASSSHDGARSIAELDEVLPTLDIVVLALPLNASTHGLIDARRLALMAPGALLVNVGRGGLVDADALMTALDSGHVRAALDVTDPEPLPSDHPLWRCPNLLITPHIGGNSEAFPPRARRLVRATLQEFVGG